jgi:hypothetical protein
MATVEVPRAWPGSTIVCVASGPSLCADDVEACRGRARVLAIKDSIRLAPWADALYGAGSDRGGWWRLNGPRLESFTGLRFTLDPAAAKWAVVLKNTGLTGLERHPSGLRIGRNSGYQGINLAVHLGAKRIVLLGYDMQPSSDGRERWFGDHPWSALSWSELGKMCVPFFETMLPALAELGIRVINASRETALTCFSRQSIAEALA